MQVATIGIPTHPSENGEAIVGQSNDETSEWTPEIPFKNVKVSAGTGLEMV